MHDDVASAFRRAAVRRLRDEFLPRLRKSVSLLDHQGLWHRENEHTNSIGVLLLHLEGNVRQWILSGLGGRADRRRRALEFAPAERAEAEVLLSRLESTVLEAVEVIESTDSPVLVSETEIQGFRETGLGAVLHVVEHFSYHLGQISHIVKTIASVDLGYFDGHDLNRHND